MKYISLLPPITCKSFPRGQEQRVMKDRAKPKKADPDPNNEDDFEDMVVTNQDYYFGRLEQAVWGKPKHAVRLPLVVAAVANSTGKKYLALEDGDYDIMKKSIHEVDYLPVWAWNMAPFREQFDKALEERPEDFDGDNVPKALSGDKPTEKKDVLPDS